MASQKEPRGYLFPDPFDPGEYSCFTVYVPKHSFYLAAFWRAYEFFTTWIAWARDPMKTGLKVAALWRIGFDRARAQYELTGGDCMPNMINVSQDGLDPCKVVFTFEDGATTTIDLAACASCGGGGGMSCLPQLRGPSGQIERYNPSTGKWEPAGPTVDPVQNGKQTPLDPTKGQTRCDAARNAADALHATKNQALAIVETTSDVLAFTGQLIIYLTPFQPELALAFGVIEICTLVLEALTPLEQSIGATDIRDDVTCIFVKHMGADGTFTEEQYQACIEDFNQHAVDDQTQPNHGCWNVENLILRLVGATGINSMAVNGVSQGYDCSGCEWQAVINFAGEPGPFAKQPYNIGGVNVSDAGKWVKNLGWGTDVVLPASAAKRELFSAIHFPVTHFTYAKIEGLTDLSGYAGHSEPFNSNFSLVPSDAPGSGSVCGSGSLGFSTASPFEFHTSDAFDAGILGLYASWQFNGGDPGFGRIFFSKLTVRGTGPVPQALAPFLK